MSKQPTFYLSINAFGFDLDSFQEKTVGNDKNPNPSQNPTKSSAFTDQKPSSIKGDRNKNYKNERENNNGVNNNFCRFGFNYWLFMSEKEIKNTIRTLFWFTL